MLDFIETVINTGIRIFTIILMVLPGILIIYMISEDTNKQTESRKFCKRKRSDYYFNKFLNYTPTEVKND